MAWRNGAGETVEIAAHPDGANLDDFEWRVSLATVTAGGPFSCFSGTDRTLAILDGVGLDLQVGNDLCRLTPASEPFGFPADVPCSAQLLSGPVSNLNVMTRRGRFASTVERLDVSTPVELAAEGTTFVLSREGTLAIGAVVLDRRDALVFEGVRTLRLTPRGPSTSIVVVRIRSV